MKKNNDVKDNVEKSVKGMRKIVQEFKDFAMRGNMIDMAVGLVIGSAFTGMVKSIVDDTFMPLIQYLVGGDTEYKGLSWHSVNYGLTINAIINFIILAAVVFLVVKAMNALASIKEDMTSKECEADKSSTTELELLTEIRDLLQEQKEKDKENG